MKVTHNLVLQEYLPKASAMLLCIFDDALQLTWERQTYFILRTGKKVCDRSPLETVIGNSSPLKA